MGENSFQDEIIITSDNKVLLKDKVPFRIIFPSFEVFSSPNIKIDDIKQRRFNMIGGAAQKARDDIMSQEDSSIFEALDKIGVTKE